MIREFFYLQKSDRKVILSLLVVIVSVFTMICLTGGNDTSTTTTQKNSPRSAARKNHYYASSPKKVERFAFDPNTADSTQLLRLGLQPWQVRNIYKYRAAGGIYRQPIDFAKLYGLTVKQYRELEPYIRISSDYTTPAATLVGEEEHYERDTLKYPIKVEVPSSVNLNSVDTLQLRKVPGVGEAFARRIISYGQRLGGYVSPEQLREIEDFPADAIPYFVVNRPNIRKINVNKLTLNQLQRHPYISFYQAKAIMEYRRLRGPLQSLDDLKLHRDFPPEAINRLKPYVDF